MHRGGEAIPANNIVQIHEKPLGDMDQASENIRFFWPTLFPKADSAVGQHYQKQQIDQCQARQQIFRSVRQSPNTT